MRAERVRATLALAGLLAGCHPVALLTRPEGDGGWSVDRRQAELDARATRAAVPLDPATAPAAPVPDGPLTLADALALAGRGNRPIAIASQRVEAAGARVRDSRGRLLPNVTGGGRRSWYTDQQTIAIETAGLIPPGTPAPVAIIRDQNFGVVNGTASLALDLSGELRHALRAAQAGYRGEQARLWATTLDQQVATIRAYFQLLEAERLREVTRQTVTLQHEQLDNAQERFDAGRLTKNELLVVQVSLLASQEEMTRRDLVVDHARWTLNDVIGLPIDAPTTVADVRERPSIPSAADALRVSYEHNPVLGSLLEEQQRLEAITQALARGWLPRFTGGGTVDYSTSEIPLPQKMGGAFVGFSWDLSTDGRRAAQIAEARAEAERNRIAVEQELRALEAAVRATQRGAEERLVALGSAEAAVGQAEENLRIRQQQFGAGRATSEDVLDAEALLARQRATLATARYQAHTRRAELQQLMGLPLDDVVAAVR